MYYQRLEIPNLNIKNNLTEKRQLLKMSSNDSLIQVCENWQYNRPLDVNRVDQIRKYIEKNNCVEGIIYMAMLNGRLVCYEGNHRLNAVKNYNNIETLIDYMENGTYDDIKYMFENLNKAESVSELYFDHEIDKSFICDIVLKIERKWPMMRGGLGPTRRCQTGNFSVDKLKDQFYNYFKNKMYDNTLTVDDVMSKIEILNNDYKNNSIFLTRFKPRALAKCNRYNCYIFLKDFTEDL